MNIPEGKTLYVTFNSDISASQIFKRNALIANENLKIFNYVPPHMYERFNTLSTYCKAARDLDQDLRTKIVYGANDLVLMEKRVGDLRYTVQPLDKYGQIPPFNLNLIWPAQVQDIPIFTPPKGRNKKRILSSPKSSPETIKQVYKKSKTS